MYLYQQQKGTDTDGNLSQKISSLWRNLWLTVMNIFLRAIVLSAWFLIRHHRAIPYHSPISPAHHLSIPGQLPTSPHPEVFFVIIELVLILVLLEIRNRHRRPCAAGSCCAHNNSIVLYLPLRSWYASSHHWQPCFRTRARANECSAGHALAKPRAGTSRRERPAAASMGREPVRIPMRVARATFQLFPPGLALIGIS